MLESWWLYEGDNESGGAGLCCAYDADGAALIVASSWAQFEAEISRPGRSDGVVLIVGATGRRYRRVPIMTMAENARPAVSPEPAAAGVPAASFPGDVFSATTRDIARGSRDWEM